ncbi:MAG: hypothetical protein ACFB10_16690 [Salibacteraceae bacterium]
MSRKLEPKQEYITSYSNGLAQDERHLAPLASDYVKIDERTLTDLVLFTQEFSRLVLFYNADNEIFDDWRRFFQKSQVVTLATISQIKLDVLAREFSEHTQVASRIFPGNVQLRAIKRMFADTLDLALLLDRWLKDLRKENRQLRVANQIRKAITGDLATSMCRFGKYAEEAATPAGLNTSMNVDTASLSNVWDNEGCTAESIFIGATPQEKISHGASFIAAIFQKLLQEALRVQATAQRELSSTLSDLTAVKPHIGLLVAFFKIYRHTQQSLNTISERHLRFYYRSVLRMVPQSFVPDNALVYFDLTPGDEAYSLAAGSLLLAGKDATNKTLYYELRDGLDVLPAKIQQINTQFVASNPLVYTGTDSAGYITNVFSQSNADQTAVSRSGSMPRWALFGEDQYEKSDRNRTMQDARIGFALASPTLYLQEGERSITFQIRFQKEDFEQGMLKWLQEMADNQKISVEAAFSRIMLDALTLELTTETGWVTIERYNAIFNQEQYRMDLLLELDVTQPAIDGYQEKIHQSRLETSWPVCLVTFRPEAPVYPLSLLSGMRLSDFYTKVSVTGVKNLSLYNQDSKLSVDNPFMPFGATPSVGDQFIIGSSEALEKQLTSLEILLQWSNLPTDPNGFKDYYANYDVEINNEDYKVRLSRLKDRKWQPLGDARQQFDMFETKEEGSYDNTTPLSDTTTFDNIDTERLDSSPTYAFTKTQEFNQQTQSGYVAFEMTAPEFGFGQNDYTDKLNEVNLINANLVIKNKNKETVDLKPLPNPPFSPEAKAVSLNYSAESNLFPAEGEVRKNPIDGDQLFHLHPFGEHEIPIATDRSSVLLAPDLLPLGNLMLGLSGIQGGEVLSLYMMISEGSVSDNLRMDPKVQWWYLQDNQWKPFEEHELLMDTTFNAIQAGLVKLQLPARMDTEHELMPTGLVWLRASIPSSLQLTRTIYGVAVNGGAVVWKNQDNDLAHLESPMLAGSINAIENQPASIKSVNQPFPSMNGKMPENDTAFHIRASERLRHKNRAVTYTDYEMLVLQQFSEIYKAKCFSAMTQDSLSDQGNVLVALIPDIEDPRVNNVFRPKFSRSKLETIRNFISERASPFVKIDVLNPFYERIRVVCTVAFVNQQNNGALVKQLDQDISVFLTPWLSKGQGRVEFGGSLYKSDIQAFIEGRDYVGFVTGFSVVKTVDNDGKYFFTDTADPSLGDGQEEIVPLRPWSILVSATSHEISVQNSKNYVAPSPRGIGNMMIKTDFIVTAKTATEETTTQPET